MAVFSFHTLLYIFSSDILNYFDRLFINSQFGARNAGLYALAYNIGSILAVLWVALQSSWLPVFYKAMNTKDYAIIDYHIDKFVRMFFLISSCLILFSREIGFVLASSSFQSSFRLILIISWLANTFFLLSNIARAPLTCRLFPWCQAWPMSP